MIKSLLENNYFNQVRKNYFNWYDSYYSYEIIIKERILI